MKKIGVIFCLLFVFSGLIPQICSLSYSNPIGVEVRMHEGEPLSNGYFDLLIPSSYFVNGTDHLSITEAFKSRHPDYEAYSYLESQEWISYLAYYEGTDVIEENYPTKYVFYGHGDVLYNVSTFIIVKINDAGDVVSESELVIKPSVTPFIKLDIVLGYDQETDVFEIEQYVSTQVLLIIFIWVFGIVYIFIHFLHRFLILNWVKTDRSSERKILIFQLITLIPSTLVMVQATTKYPIFPNDYYLLIILLGIILFETVGIYVTTPDKTNIKGVMRKNGFSFIPFALLIIAIVLTRIF